MDVMGTSNNSFEKEKSMKIIRIIIIFLVILFLLSIGILGAIYYLQSKEFKVVIDGKTINNISEDVFVIENGNVYVSIREIAPYLEYKDYNGTYGDKYSENTTSCYLQNKNEVVTYSQNSSSIYKSIISEKTSENGSASTDISGLTVADSDYEYFTLSEPVQMKNNKLYTNLEGISTGCNVVASYDEKSNTVTISSLGTIINRYVNSIQDMAIAGEDAIFSNKKAILYGLVVVKNDNDKYGVSDLYKNEIIGKKYKYIKFIESSQEFIVLTDEQKVGIISKDGTTRIAPQYDEIKQIDKDDELYLVSINKKYGVINRNDKKIIYPEYDKIGIDSDSFKADNIKSPYILYENCVPVQKGDKWGILDKKGDTIVEPQFDSLGCIIGTSNSSIANNLLLIPEYEGIVVCKDKFYGLINSTGRELIPTLVTDMYSTSSEGKNTYYLTYEKQTMNVISYLRDTLGLEPVKKDITINSNYSTNNNTENTNQSVNENQNTNTTSQENGERQSSNTEQREQTQETPDIYRDISF